MSKFQNFLLIILLASIMYLLHRYAQLYFELQDVKISIGIGYVVLFATALLLPLPSAMIAILIAAVASNYSDLINGYAISTLIIEFVMLYVFEFWISYAKKMRFTIKFLPAVMLACTISVFIFFTIDLIVSGLSVAVIGLGFRSIEALICSLMSMPIVYLISIQNIGVRKYSPRYKLK